MLAPLIYQLMIGHSAVGTFAPLVRNNLASPRRNQRQLRKARRQAFAAGDRRAHKR